MGSVGGTQKQTGETRRELEESLKTYRDLGKKEPETYLPHVAAMFNDLGILDSNQNRKLFIIIAKILTHFTNSRYA